MIKTPAAGAGCASGVRETLALSPRTRTYLVPSHCLLRTPWHGVRASSLHALIGQRGNTMMTTTISQHTLTLTDTPTVEHMRAWWDAMWTDVAEQTCVFTDLMPTSLAAFLESDLLLTLITVESSVVAAMWLH